MIKRPTRRSQSVVPFGIGAIVEFEDEALMLAGLDVWPEEAERIDDERLARRLGVDSFRTPPPKPEQGGDLKQMAHLPYVRFPQWHFCPRCRWLKKAELYANKSPRCNNMGTSRRLGSRQPCGSLPERRRPRMLPLRFVAVCEAGHIEDFPWNAWAHSNAGQDIVRDSGCKPETLYFYATKKGGLSGLIVECSTCGSKRNLMGVTSKGGLKGFVCNGARPWLGSEGQEICSAPVGKSGNPEMMALQRGASNIYFPDVASSILIPPYSSRAYQVARQNEVRKHLESCRVEGRIPDEEYEKAALYRNVDPKQLRRAYELYTDEAFSDDDDDGEETTYRYAEYEALHEERRQHDDELSCRPQNVGEYGNIVREFFEQVTLVERLAETRVLTGFGRIVPATGASVRLSLGRVNWLPAFRVRGEGIFLAVKPDSLKSLTADEKTLRLLERAQRKWHSPLPLSTELVFLHTLAHLIIKRLSFEAGYGASSIRERIYSAPDGHECRMCGILLYTAAGDADGTLGGLVDLGRKGRLESVLVGALEDARCCASDPICIESNGQGPESLNLAACHACALLPETSCEMQNRLLDRNLVIRFFNKYFG